jgi:hypothetical protein
VKEPTFLERTGFVLQRAPASIRVEQLTFSIAALWVGGGAAVFSEFTADCRMVKSTFFVFVAVASGIEAAQLFLLGCLGL